MQDPVLTWFLVNVKQQGNGQQEWAEKLCVGDGTEVGNLWKLLQTTGFQKCEGKWFFIKKMMEIFITVQAILLA